MTGDVLVTGATGNVGGTVTRSLAAAGIAVRPAGTNVEVLQRNFPGMPVARLDLTVPSTFEAALRGAGALFLVRPPAIARVGPTLNALLDAAERTGVDHVIFSSVTGADTNRVVPHHRVETHLRASDLSWTILRPGFFAQNLADAYRHDVVEDDRIYLPAGKGRAAFVDVRDLGDVAAVVFANPAAYRGIGYVLTGPTALDFDDVAAMLTRALGRPIRYEPVGIVAYARHLRASGFPLAQVVVQAVLHTGLRRGQAEAVNPTLARLLGRAPRTLEDYVRDHIATWARPQPSAS